ncbi:hypothetical protein [Nocardia takedensis]|uniref:hypothetical protein n=1 Tax=Nocardia takedensis TaxID=259390 RepID=UPI00030B7CA9|nr:hypothetical protein [Nocardia takedensis]
MDAFHTMGSHSERRSPFAVPTDVRDAAAFMEMMRDIQQWSGLTGGQIAAYADLPRSTAYRFLNKDNVTLPKSREQVERFVTVCRLTGSQVVAVLAIWDRLAETADADKPRLSVIISDPGDTTCADPEEPPTAPEEPQTEQQERSDGGRQTFGVRGRRTRRSRKDARKERYVRQVAQRTTLPLLAALLLLVAGSNDTSWFLPLNPAGLRYPLEMVIVGLAIISIGVSVDSISIVSVTAGRVSFLGSLLAGILTSLAVYTAVSSYVIASGLGLLMFAAFPGWLGLLEFLYSPLRRMADARRRVGGEQGEKIEARAEMYLYGMMYGLLACGGIGFIATLVVCAMNVPIQIAILVGVVITAAMLTKVDRQDRRRPDA